MEERTLRSITAFQRREGLHCVNVSPKFFVRLVASAVSAWRWSSESLIFGPGPQRGLEPLGTVEVEVVGRLANLVLADQRDDADFRGSEPLSRCEGDLSPLHPHGARPGCTVRQIRFP